MDLRQSEKYANYMRSLGWIVEKIDETNVFIKKVLFFSVIKIQRFEKLDFEKLKLLAKKHRAVLIKLEPRVAGSHPARPDPWPLLPTKTMVLDLGNINLPKDTRYEIRKAENKSLIVRESNNIEGFYELLKETMKIGHWEIPIHKEVVNLYRSFQPNNSVLLFSSCHPDECQDLSTCLSKRSHPREMLKQVQHDTILVAGCLLVWHGNTAHYMYAALTKTGREMGAAYITLWEAIKFCQKKKLKYLDLEGIYDERFPKNNKSWLGFTKFKMGWGGKAVEYPGSFSRYITF